MEDDIEKIEQLLAPLVALLGDPSTDPCRMMEITSELRNFGESAFQKLLEVLNQDLNPITRANIAAVLREWLDSRATPALIETLKDPDATVRWQAVYSLYRLWDKRASTPLIPLLEDPDDRVRREAAYALGCFNDENAILPLIEALNDENEDVRVSAALSLGNLGDKIAVEPLIRQLKSESPLVRWHSVEALGKLKNSAAVEPLIALLQKEDEAGQAFIVRALGELRDPRTIEPLIMVLKNGSIKLSREAGHILKQMGEPTLPFLLISLKECRGDVCQRIASIMAKMKPAPVGSLIAALQNEDKIIRFWVIRTLEVLGDPTTIPYLEQIAWNDNEVDEKIKRAAFQAIKRISK